MQLPDETATATPWIGTATARAGTIGLAFFAALLLRRQDRGESLRPLIVSIAVALIVLSVLLTVGWQGITRSRPWPWFTTFLGFVLVLVGVCILSVGVLRALR